MKTPLPTPISGLRIPCSRPAGFGKNLRCAPWGSLCEPDTQRRSRGHPRSWPDADSRPHWLSFETCLLRAESQLSAVTALTGTCRRDAGYRLERYRRWGAVSLKGKRAQRIRDGLDLLPRALRLHFRGRSHSVAARQLRCDPRLLVGRNARSQDTSSPDHIGLSPGHAGLSDPARSPSGRSDRKRRREGSPQRPRIFRGSHTDICARSTKRPFWKVKHCGCAPN